MMPCSHLASMRSCTVLAGFRARSGLSDERCDDVVLAATAIATNAVEHGAGKGVRRRWTAPDSVDIVVTDDGRISTLLAGLLHPAPEQIRGRGAWLAHQLCDSVYLWTDPTTTVRLHRHRTGGEQRSRGHPDVGVIRPGP
jgi:anti-sigma regulatory factor (Ser/Thr protein kinase)